MGGWDAPWHWIVLIILVIALVGYKKLPDATRSLGRSLRIFKTEIKGMADDDKARNAAETGTVAQATPPVIPTAVEPPALELPTHRPRPTPNGMHAAQPRVSGDQTGVQR